jgi:hypothetical protein
MSELIDFYYSKAAAQLALESGQDLESQTMAMTRRYVLEGEWLKLNQLVPELELSDHIQKVCPDV